MRKNAKKLTMLLLAVVFMAGCMFMTSTQANAQTTDATLKVDKAHGIMYHTGIRISPNSTYEYLYMYFQNPNYYVSSVKSNSTALIAKVSYDQKHSDYTNTYTYGSNNNKTFEYKRLNKIDLFTVKPGKYKLTVTIKNAKNKKVTSKNIFVYAGYPSSPVSSFSYGNTSYYTYNGLTINTTKASGKIKVKGNSTYKIKKIEYATTFNKKGNPNFTKTNSGKTIKLATKTQKFTRTLSTDDYSYGTYTSKNNINYLKPVTIIKITYYDKLLKVFDSEQYYIFNTKK